MDSGTIRYWTAWMWDFTSPTFRKFEIFDMGPCKSVYRRL